MLYFLWGDPKRQEMMVIMLVSFKRIGGVVKGSMMEVVLKAFKGEFKIDDIIHTLIVLVPKVDKPELISQSISLCNVIYKCISKIIVNRLKEFLPGWVSTLQASYVPGRCI